MTHSDKLARIIRTLEWGAKAEGVTRTLCPAACKGMLDDIRWLQEQVQEYDRVGFGQIFTDRLATLVSDFPEGALLP
jgi:hypothetical protein